MTDYIEKIEKNECAMCDYELDSVHISLNIDCPICGKHEVYSRTCITKNPILLRDRPKCVGVVGCFYCDMILQTMVEPNMTLDEYKDYLNQALVPNWLDAVSKDDNIHAWKRDSLFDVANGKQSREFWEYIHVVRMKERARNPTNICASED